MPRKYTQKSRLRKLMSYGLSEDEAKAQLAKTHCDCCGQPFGEETPHIDYDRATNKFRGMTHLQCSVAVGMFKDSVASLIMASRYVDTFRDSPLNRDSGEGFLAQLELIANEDVEGLKRAYQSYGPSWKQGGGANAFFMLKRKWDRLLNRLQSPDLNYDIFKGIATDQRGEGLIDDVRDLRRYLLLVEGELRARGFKRQHRDNHGKEVINMAKKPSAPTPKGSGKPSKRLPKGTKGGNKPC